jgi:hypothetical protein
MRARFYEPFTGQFLQRDPMEYEDSVNMYAALGQSPVNFRDPMGTANSPIAGSTKAVALSEAIAETASGRRLVNLGHRPPLPPSTSPFRTSVQSLGPEASVTELRQFVMASVRNAQKVAMGVPEVTGSGDATELYRKAPQLMTNLLNSLEGIPDEAVKFYPEATFLEATVGGAQKHGYIALSRIADPARRAEHAVHEVGHLGISYHWGFGSTVARDFLRHETFAWRTSMAFDMLRNARTLNVTPETAAFMERGRAGLYEHFLESSVYTSGEAGITKALIRSEGESVWSEVSNMMEQFTIPKWR